MSFIIAYMTVT